MDRWRRLLDTLATVLLITVAAVLLWDRFHGRKPRAPAPAVVAPPADAQPIRSAPLHGNTAARVVIIEYSDFQCPFCAKFSNEILPALSAKYVEDGRVALAFRNYPLKTVHPRAIDAAIAADCAGRQGRFWAVHDRLFQTQADAGRWDLPSIARSAGVDMPQWTDCLGGAGKDSVAADVRQARALGLSSTPVFLIGVQEPQHSVRVTDVIIGAQPARAFERVLDRLLRGSPPLL